MLVRNHPRRRVGLVLGCATLLLLLVSSAQASSSAEFAYPESRVWTSAVRLVRLELESPITEKDRDNGYFLFEFPHQGKSYAGSVEVVALPGERGPRVKVVVSVSKMPSYVERMVLSKLGRKLKRDFGAPGVGSGRDRDDDKPKDAPEEAPDGEDGDGVEGAPKDDEKP